MTLHTAFDRIDAFLQDIGLRDERRRSIHDE